MEGLRLDQLAEALREAGIRQAFTPDVSRLTVRLWREIARGGPVSPQRVEQIASALDLPQQTAREVLHKMCERDRDGNVVGIAGLSQNQHPHRFTVNGIRLSTWCAWDSLFLPVMLQQTALVSSPCPTTGETIRLTITPEGVTSYQPASIIRLDLSSSHLLLAEVCSSPSTASGCSHMLRAAITWLMPWLPHPPGAWSWPMERSSYS